MTGFKSICAVFTLLCLLVSPCLGQTEGTSPIWLIDVKGAIGPATSDHMIRGLEQAQAAGAPMVVLKIDTPGGLSSAMRQMIKAILASHIPVIAYVAPSGARAASAGTYILYASHVAAMAPATNLGAATPVQIGTPSLPTLPKPAKPAPNKQPDPQNPKSEPSLQPALDPSLQNKSAMERKVINDAVAYIESLAELRGRNAKWAKQAVLVGASLSSDQALAKQVIDLSAHSVQDLLNQLDGRVIKMDDKDVTLKTQGVGLYHHPIDWRSEFLAVITNPNVAYILMLIGIYGLIFEFTNPGLGVPGVLGSVCLLLALYAFQVLPVSYAGLALILLGIGLMTAEAFMPSFGIVGLGGIVAFVFGSIILMDTKVPGYQIALPLIVAISSLSALLLMVSLAMILKARRQLVITGLPQLVGQYARVESIHEDAVFIRLEGELWQVMCEQALTINDSIEITAADGLVLKVKKQGD